MIIHIALIYGVIAICVYQTQRQEKEGRQVLFKTVIKTIKWSLGLQLMNVLQ